MAPEIGAPRSLIRYLPVRALAYFAVAAMLMLTPALAQAGAGSSSSSNVLPDTLHYTDAASQKRPSPTDEAEIAGLRIHWWFNRTFDAYTQALAGHRPTIVFFNAKPCGFCKTMAEKFRCPALVRYAGEMEFAMTYRGEDDGGDHLAAALNVQRFPTTVMFDTDLDRLHVIGRIEGVFSADEIGGVITEGFKEVAASGLRPQPQLASVEKTRKALDTAGIARPSEAFCKSKQE